MSYQTNEKKYLELIDEFLTAEIDAESFCRKFFPLWKSDRDEQYAMRDNWSERYDLQLYEAFRQSEITGEELTEKSAGLYGYADHKELIEMLDSIFTACDAYDPHPENDYEIDENGLRMEVESHLTVYQSSQKAG